MTNTGPHFMMLLEWIPFNKLHWAVLSQNPNAIHLLEKNLDKVDWYVLSLNPNAIHLLENNLDKVSWFQLSQNPNAIHLLEQNLDKVYWDWLSYHPKIFGYDYKAMKDKMFSNGGIKEDLVKNRFHPRNIRKWKGWGQCDVCDDLEDDEDVWDDEEWLKH